MENSDGPWPQIVIGRIKSACLCFTIISLSTDEDENDDYDDDNGDDDDDVDDAYDDNDDENDDDDGKASTLIG